jgi:two-component system, OmpR family, alkaline phosphatase synthesis response regulator PhoP
LENSKKILVADDEVSIRRLLQLKLENGGYQVITAANGLEALELIRSQKPDVMITDINMPGMDGVSLCRLTNAMKSERPFLTIVITARISQEDRIWAEGMQETRFMEKPFSPSKLLAYINAYFGMDG